MATVHNPTGFALYCAPLGVTIASEDTVEVSEEVAAKVSTCVFVVTNEAPEDEAPKRQAPASRKSTTRGAKTVEVTEAPVTETR